MPKHAGFLASTRAIALLVATITLLLFCNNAGASDLTGTWQGMLTEGNKTFQTRVTFSENGFLIFSYRDNRGQVRSVELTTPGQQIQYVPPGGGVKTHVVEAVSQQPGQYSLVLRTRIERTRGGYLSQQFILEADEFKLTTQGLEFREVIRSQNYFGDKSLYGGGGENEIVGVAVLQKVAE